MRKISQKIRLFTATFIICTLLKVLNLTQWLLPVYTKSPSRSTETKTPVFLTTSTHHITRKDSISPERHLDDKYVIYRCNSTRLCGGLADRQKGIVSAYIMSQMLRWKFGIIMTKGCDVSKYLIPNEVNWLVDEDKLKGKSTAVKRFIDNKMAGPTLSEIDLEDMFDKDVTYYEGNIDYVNFLKNSSSFQSLEWTRDKSHHDIYRIALSHLFKFAPTTQKRFEEFLTKTENTSLTCVHLRMGQSKTIPKDVNLSKRRPNTEEVIRFLKRNTSQKKKLKLFIATDSDEVRHQMSDAFPDIFVELEGPIVHIDRYGQDYECSGLEKAILDQFILSTCDSLIMSDSGFSRLAAITRGTDDNLYVAGPQYIKKTRRLNPTHPYFSALH